MIRSDVAERGQRTASEGVEGRVERHRRAARSADVVEGPLGREWSLALP